MNIPKASAKPTPARILIVEDEIIVAKDIEAMLNNLGYDVPGIAGSGEEALEMARAQHPDLVLMDIQLKGEMDGILTSARLNELYELPVIYLSAFTEEETLQRAKLTGPFGYIPKPFDSRDLRIAVEIALYRYPMERKLRESEERFRLMAEHIQDGLAIIEHGKTVYFNDQLCEIVGYPRQDFENMTSFDLAAPEEVERLKEIRDQAENGLPITELEYWIVTKDGERRCIQNRYSLVKRGNEIIGRYIVTSNITERKQAEETQTRLLQAVEQELAERKRAEEIVRLQLERLAGLRQVDMAISASLDLRVMLNVLLDQVMAQLNPDAADILLYNPNTQTLSVAAGRGFTSSATQPAYLRLGDGLVGLAALERRTMYWSQTPLDPEVSLPSLTPSPFPPFQKNMFSACIATPLIAKGQVKGVLEVYRRGSFTPTADWLSFLDMLAGQAAIAIDNASLFEDLQRSNLQLKLAYDTTLEGWSRALDLRDQETEGHTQRVTALAVQLAASMNMSPEEIGYVRRGALLHDIGKMGIPDDILHKPGPLAEDEWKIMRQHPTYAYELLSPIAYLGPAVDIPYCHHEKWDGTGYPRGLKGEQIPLSARIFALADVWDALRSIRPYRPAWSEEQARNYICSQKGKHFDPDVVDKFLELSI